jgi:alpha-glucoside transport system substrate-binding protein
MVVAGDLVAMFRRTPQSEAFIRYLASASAQSFWARSAAGLSANLKVPLDRYPDPVSRKAAAALTQVREVVFGAGDMMPGEMSSAFWSACMSFVADPAGLDEILAGLEAVRKDAYHLPGN